MSELQQAHRNMLEQQLKPNEVMSSRILDAMTALPRALFVDTEMSGLAYVDTTLPIGHNQYMWSPLLEGKVLQALDLQPHETVLEIGTGSGFLTALMSQLVAQVISVDYFDTFTQQARERLKSLGIDNVELATGDAAKGWHLTDRVDVIVLTAAVETVPDNYLHSLNIGGRMLALVGRPPAISVQLITRISEWDWETDTLFETVVAPMLHAEPIPQFEF
jgi:protein-L-isoaspartate(D-aspartate) O-methyltransferase